MNSRAVRVGALDWGSVAIALAITTFGLGLLVTGLSLEAGLVQLTLLLGIVAPALVLAFLDSPKLISYITAVYAFAPLIRRVVDYELGSFQVVSLLSIANVIATSAVLMPICRSRVKLPPSYRLPLGLICAVFALGLPMGVLGNGSSALLDLANYTLPASIALYFALRRPSPTECEGILRDLVGTAILVSGYGIYQFVVMTPWDAFWMNSVKMDSIGQPLPLQVRVFSTMNSPGILGPFLALALAASLTNARTRGLLGPLGTLAITTCFLLTMVRSAWIECLAAVFVFVIVGGLKRQGRTLVTVLGVCVLLIVALPFLPGGKMIENRLTSMQSVGSDKSYQARSGFSAKMVAASLKSPFGKGLGGIGAASKINGGGNEDGLTGAFDNGYLALAYTFGILGAVVLVGSIVHLGLQAARQARANEENYFARFACGACGGLLTCLFFGDCIVGPEAYCFWLPLGCWFACSKLAPAASRFNATTRAASIPKPSFA